MVTWTSVARSTCTEATTKSNGTRLGWGFCTSEIRRQPWSAIHLSTNYSIAHHHHSSFPSTTSTMSVRVVARIRPLLKNELGKDTIVTAESPEGENATNPTIIRIPSPKNDAESFSFQFSSVYEQNATQQQLFDGEGAWKALIVARNLR
jgi:hypothetical protein